jgi:hypothetical protein
VPNDGGGALGGVGVVPLPPPSAAAGRGPRGGPPAGGGGGGKPPGGGGGGGAPAPAADARGRCLLPDGAVLGGSGAVGGAWKNTFGTDGTPPVAAAPRVTFGRCRALERVPPTLGGGGGAPPATPAFSSRGMLGRGRPSRADRGGGGGGAAPLAPPPGGGGGGGGAPAPTLKGALVALGLGRCVPGGAPNPPGPAPGGGGGGACQATAPLGRCLMGGGACGGGAWNTPSAAKLGPPCGAFTLGRERLGPPPGGGGGGGAPGGGGGGGRAPTPGGGGGRAPTPGPGGGGGGGTDATAALGSKNGALWPGARRTPGRLRGPPTEPGAAPCGGGGGGASGSRLAAWLRYPRWMEVTAAPRPAPGLPPGRPPGAPGTPGGRANPRLAGPLPLTGGGGGGLSYVPIRRLVCARLAIGGGFGFFLIAFCVIAEISAAADFPFGCSA